MCEILAKLMDLGVNFLILISAQLPRIGTEYYFRFVVIGVVAENQLQVIIFRLSFFTRVWVEEEYRNTAIIRADGKPPQLWS